MVGVGVGVSGIVVVDVGLGVSVVVGVGVGVSVVAVLNGEPVVPVVVVVVGSSVALEAGFSGSLPQAVSANSMLTVSRMVSRRKQGFFINGSLLCVKCTNIVAQPK